MESSLASLLRIYALLVVLSVVCQVNLVRKIMEEDESSAG